MQETEEVLDTLCVRPHMDEDALYARAAAGGRAPCKQHARSRHPLAPARTLNSTHSLTHSLTCGTILEYRGICKIASWPSAVLPDRCLVVVGVVVVVVAAEVVVVVVVVVSARHAARCARCSSLRMNSE